MTESQAQLGKKLGILRKQSCAHIKLERSGEKDVDDLGSGLQDKGLDEAFWPIFQLDEEGKDKNKLLQGGLRVGTAASLIGLSYAFYHHVPDKGNEPSILGT